MLYTSERNYGCRFLEVSIFGYRAVILENERIRTTILLDKGAEIIEFNQKDTDTDVIWRSPLGLSCLRKIKSSLKDEQFLTDGYTGGWFELFPNTGGSCSYKGASVPHYGEVCYLPWEYIVVKDEPDEVILKCFVRTTKTPFLLEKTLTVKSNVPTLFIDESIKNLGMVELDFQWGHHPNFGSNIIDENCELDMPGGDMLAQRAAGVSRFSPGTEGKWPYMKDASDNVIDLRVVLPKGAGFLDVVEVYDLKEGYTSIKNHKKGIAVELEWDINMFKHTVIWNVSNGDLGYPRYGDTYVLGFLLSSDRCRGLEESSSKGISRKIKPQETIKTWLTASIKTLS